MIIQSSQSVLLFIVMFFCVVATYTTTATIKHEIQVLSDSKL
jgi:hypothetical protein